MARALDRCPAWTTDKLATLGSDIGHLRMQLDWLLEDLDGTPDGRVGYLESQIAGYAAELARLDGALAELRLALGLSDHPDPAAADGPLPLAAAGDA